MILTVRYDKRPHPYLSDMEYNCAIRGVKDRGAAMVAGGRALDAGASAHEWVKEWKDEAIYFSRKPSVAALIREDDGGLMALELNGYASMEDCERGVAVAMAYLAARRGEDAMAYLAARAGDDAAEFAAAADSCGDDAAADEPSADVAGGAVKIIFSQSRDWSESHEGWGFYAEGAYGKAAAYKACEAAMAAHKRRDEWRMVSAPAHPDAVMVSMTFSVGARVCEDADGGASLSVFGFDRREDAEAAALVVVESLCGCGAREIIGGMARYDRLACVCDKGVSRVEMAESAASGW